MDCFANQICSAEDRLETLDWQRVNPATGPIYVNGAEAGDVLKITIKEIQIADQGVVATGKDLGVLGHLMMISTLKWSRSRTDKLFFTVRSLFH